MNFILCFVLFFNDYDTTISYIYIYMNNDVIDLYIYIYKKMIDYDMDFKK